MSVSVTNRGDAVLDSFALEIFSSSAWNSSSQGVIPTALAPGQGFQTHYMISPKDSENVGGWTAFGGRIDYVSRGTPKTHYLFRDEVLPISPTVKNLFLGPNCQVAGPILGGTSNLAGILAEAEGQWTDLPYDPIDRPSVINLAPIYYPANLLAPGVRVLSSHLISDTAQQGVLKLLQQYRLTGFRFWINGSELVFANGCHAFTLNPGVNRLIAICDAVNGIEPFYTWPVIVVAFEPVFYQPGGVTPLSGVTFTAGNTPPVMPVIPAASLCPGQTLRFRLDAADRESAPGNLSYSLVRPVPDGAIIGSRSGLFEWTPRAIPVPSTNSITVRVTDDGFPAMSAERTFTVIVLPDLCLQLEHDAGGGQWSLTWITVPGKTYRVEFTTDLSAPAWTAFGPNRIADTDSLNAGIVLTGGTQKFFRVVRID